MITPKYNRGVCKFVNRVNFFGKKWGQWKNYYQFLPILSSEHVKFKVASVYMDAVEYINYMVAGKDNSFICQS